MLSRLPPRRRPIAGRRACSTGGGARPARRFGPALVRAAESHGWWPYGRGGPPSGDDVPQQLAVSSSRGHRQPHGLLAGHESRRRPTRVRTQSRAVALGRGSIAARYVRVRGGAAASAAEADAARDGAPSRPARASARLPCAVSSTCPSRSCSSSSWRSPSSSREAGSSPRTKERAGASGGASAHRLRPSEDGVLGKVTSVLQAGSPTKP